jgi:hypothetical protein
MLASKMFFPVKINAGFRFKAASGRRIALAARLLNFIFLGRLFAQKRRIVFRRPQIRLRTGCGLF